ncbi:MAG: hypothetical protein KDK44_02925 [Chlamydiia bacterium]|nr:hypothetical protein [Chlamydiia bacterium]MCP5509283.1 hypothetical protein [Chlamydiales bacterium]
MAMSCASSPDESTCAICFEPIGQPAEKTEVTTLICKHVFHTDCINPWLLTRLSCPLCRRGTVKNIFAKPPKAPRPPIASPLYRSSYCLPPATPKKKCTLF